MKSKKIQMGNIFYNQGKSLEINQHAENETQSNHNFFTNNFKNMLFHTIFEFDIV